jgi:NAD(P)-dependent dehydrogenase (short-subunit alcohol dehydrogenase family)
MGHGELALAGSVAIVTGGANGIGQATVECFLSEGAIVAVFDIDDSALAEMRKRHAKFDNSNHLRMIQCDISDSSAVIDSVGRVIDEFQNIHILVNNAAIDLRNHGDGLVEEWDEPAIARTIDVNLRGMMSVSKAVLPHMVRQKSGSIISMSSIGAILGAEMLAYSASKGGVISFTRSVGVQYGRHGIRANVICPGLVETGMAQHLLSGDGRRASLERAIPLGRVANPDEIARVAVFLASQDASYINASVIVADGGLSSR